MQLVRTHLGSSSPKARLSSFLLLIGLGIASNPAVGAPSQPVNPPCVPFSGTFVFTLFAFDSLTTAHAEADVWADGVVIAYATARYFNIEQKGQGVIQMNGEHTLTFPDGSTLVTYDEIRLQSDNQDPAWAQANSRLYIVGGTGAYDGATGLLHTHGEANLVTLEGGIGFKGRVCVP